MSVDARLTRDLLARNPMTERVYCRRLPGGGYVAVDVVRVRRPFRRSVYTGIVLVERRTTGDRDRTQQPVVIAELSGPDVESVLRALLPAAECNSAIGSALLRRTPGGLPPSPAAGRPAGHRAAAAVHA